MIDPRLRRLQAQADTTFERIDVGTRAIVPLPIDVAKANAKSRLAAWRYAQEIGGVSFGGSTIATDRDTQDALNRIINALDRGMIAEPVTYKGAGGWASLTKAQLVAIATAIADHVQACWAAEKMAADQIDAAQTIDAMRAVLTQAGA